MSYWSFFKHRGMISEEIGVHFDILDKHLELWHDKKINADLLKIISLLKKRINDSLHTFTQCLISHF